MYELQVSAGVNLLDREIPNWREQIDRDQLDMSLVDGCVLSELFGGYLAGLDKLGIPRYTQDDVKCGFDLDGADIPKGYQALTDEWIRRIVEK